MLKEMMNIHMATASRLFIVNAPIAVRDDEYDHDAGVMLNRDNNNKAIKYDPSRRDNFGITILRMAEVFRDGLGFTLYNREDLPILINIMEEYLKWADVSKRAINFRQMDTHSVDLIYEFGKNVLSINTKAKKNHNEDFKKIENNLGMVNLANAISIVEKENRDKLERKRATSQVVRFRPMHL